MAQDIMSKFYTCMNLGLDDKLIEFAKIIDQSSANKDLQAFFVHLINHIFSSSFGNGWNLKMVTCDSNKHAFEALTSFLEPQGPMFRLCYKLLSDSQLKFDLPVNVLPLDLQMALERGRCPQFYTDMLVMDAQSMNVVALALNPFDYYIFNFALHLVNNSQQQSIWENWNSAYFALACDYLMHFLPSDPNLPVLPHIPYYNGKVPMVTPLQTTNRPMYASSLLLLPDLCGMGNQHTSPQNQSRNEVWRSETILQVFIDIWMSVEQFNPRDAEAYQRNYNAISSSPERVRIVRVLVKHIHSFSAKHMSDPASRSSALRKYARQVMCARAYHYIRHLVTTWPLDASFRLVIELWLSLIQPWRYTNNTINQDRFPGTNNNTEETAPTTLDASHTQFIAENFPAYNCILQLVLPRFMRLDLTAYKNAVMLFRLGKVFSQQHLVPILYHLEQAIMDNASFHHSLDTSFNSSSNEQRYTYNGIPLHKWVAIAKQAISELNMSTNFEYDPVWADNKTAFALDFVKKIYMAKMTADNVLQEHTKKINEQNQGMWSSVKNWLMIGPTYEEEALLEEYNKVPNLLNASIQHFSNIFGYFHSTESNNRTVKNWLMIGPTYEEEALLEQYNKVPNLLNASIQHFSNIFGLSENTMLPTETVIEDTEVNSSFANSTNYLQYITNKLRTRHTDILYMGDPDLMPIASYESTILVRILYQISSKLNELYQQEFSELWSRNDLQGYVAREILHKPCTVRNYVKNSSYHHIIVSQELPARLSLRPLGSHRFAVWFIAGYLLSSLFSFSGYFYVFFLATIWLVAVITKASLKYLKVISSCNC